MNDTERRLKEGSLPPIYLLVDATPPGSAIPSEATRCKEKVNQQGYLGHVYVAGRIYRRAKR